MVYYEKIFIMESIHKLRLLLSRSYLFFQFCFLVQKFNSVKKTRFRKHTCHEHNSFVFQVLALISLSMGFGLRSILSPWNLTNCSSHSTIFAMKQSLGIVSHPLDFISIHRPSSPVGQLWMKSLHCPGYFFLACIKIEEFF